MGENAYGNKQLLKMDSFADIPNGSTTASADVTEKTGLVANYIVEKVIKPSGSKFDKDTSTELYEQALEAINDKLVSGDLIRISPVEAIASEENILEFGETNATQKLNVEIIDNDDTLRDAVKKASFESKSSQITTLEDAKSLIRAIFGQDSQNSSQSSKNGGGDNGPPDFFVTQFAQAWLNNVDVSISTLATAYNASLTNQSIKDYLTVAHITALLLAQGSDDNSVSKLKKLYAIYDTGTDDTSIPYYAKVIFPKNNRWSLPISSSPKLTVPQKLFFMLQAGLINGEAIPERLRSQSHDIPFDPFALLTAINFVDIQSGNFYITDKQIRPIKTYKQTEDGMWRPVDALESSVQVYADSNTIAQLHHVTLTYPKALGAEGTVSYQRQSNSQGGNEGGNNVASSVKKAKLASKGISKLMSENNQSENTMDAQWVISPYPRGNGFTPSYVTDYVSGEATITAYNAANQVLVSEKVTIIKPNLGPVTWQYPKGQNMALLQSQGWDPNFTPDAVDVDDQEKAYPILQWTAPTGTIPTGYYLAYAINLGLSINKNMDSPTALPSTTDGIISVTNGTNNWDHSDTSGTYKWKQVWSSWDSNRLITAQSFRLPVPLNKTVSNSSYRTTYEVNITPVLVENKSGRVVWQGTESRTNFMVGQTTPWSVTIHGTVTFSSKLMERLPRDLAGNIIPGTWKIGLFKTGGPNEQGQWTDYFNSTGSKSPVGTGASQMIYTLDQASIATNGSSTYSLPTFSKSAAFLTKNTGYSLIVWYDVTTTPDTPAWLNVGIRATSGSIDLSTNSYLEFFEHGQGNFWMDRDGLRISNHQTGQSTTVFEPNTESVQNISVGQYLTL